MPHDRFRSYTGDNAAKREKYECKNLYPSGPPKRLVLNGNTAQVRMQQACLGVYELVPHVEKEGCPIWKHTIEDRCIVYGTTWVGEDEQAEPGWVVAQATTLRAGVERRYMQLPGEANPWKSDRCWQAHGRKGWVEQDSIKCTMSAHGTSWGTSWQIPKDTSLLKSRFTTKRPGSPGSPKSPP